MNEALAQGETWKTFWHWLRLPDPSLAKSTRADDWWAVSPFAPSEKTPSFHMNAKGWCCFSSGKNGSFLNLAAELLGTNIYHAAHEVREALLGEVNVSPVPSSPVPAVEEAQQSFQAQAAETVSTSANEPANVPIRVDLMKSRYCSAEDERFDHRGIPLSVFEELGAGYLERPERADGKPDPLNHRQVFQIRGVELYEGRYRSVILSHMGRAALEEQPEKWWFFPGFQARFELYNIDLALLDPTAREQARQTGQVVVVEGAYDVARLLAANIRNVVATFGKQMHEEQLPRFQLLAEELGIDRFVIFYDRGQDGYSQTPQGRMEDGAVKAAKRLRDAGFQSDIFRWDRRFSNGVRQNVPIPSQITDPCEFSSEVLSWFRGKGVI